MKGSCPKVSKMFSHWCCQKFPDAPQNLCKWLKKKVIIHLKEKVTKSRSLKFLKEDWKNLYINWHDKNVSNVQSNVMKDFKKTQIAQMNNLLLGQTNICQIKIIKNNFLKKSKYPQTLLIICNWAESRNRHVNGEEMKNKSRGWKLSNKGNQISIKW